MRRVPPASSVPSGSAIRAAQIESRPKSVRYQGDPAARKSSSGRLRSDIRSACRSATRSLRRTARAGDRPQQSLGRCTPWTDDARDDDGVPSPARPTTTAGSPPTGLPPRCPTAPAPPPSSRCSRAPGRTMSTCSPVGPVAQPAGRSNGSNRRARQARLHPLDLGQIGGHAKAQRRADVAAGPVDDRQLLLEATDLGAPPAPQPHGRIRGRIAQPADDRDEFGSARTQWGARDRVGRRPVDGDLGLLSTRTSATNAPWAPSGRICPSRSDSTTQGAARQVTRSCSNGCRPTAALTTLGGDEIVIASRERTLDTFGDGGNTTTILGSIQ